MLFDGSGGTTSAREDISFADRAANDKGVLSGQLATSAADSAPPEVLLAACWASSPERLASARVRR